MNDIIDNLMGGELFIQIAIPIGYICYFLARFGVGGKDKPVHIIYISLVFSSISVLSWTLSAYLWTWRPYGQIISSVIAPILISISWRSFLCGWIYWILNYLSRTKAREYRSIFSEITNDASIYFAEIIVYLKNGKILICDSTYDFKEVPIKEYRIDGDENIALYVTAIKDSEGAKAVEIDDPVMKGGSGDEKYRLTYVKESEISRIEFVYVRLRSRRP